jgi:hypothetical protein
LAEVLAPVRIAPALIRSLTPRAEKRRLATPVQHRRPATRGDGKRARAAELIASAARPILDALLYGVLVGLVFFLSAYALTRARLRLLAGRSAATRVGSSTGAFGTTLASRPEVARFITAANGADVRPARGSSSADRSTQRPAPRLAAVPPAAPSAATDEEAGPCLGRGRRHRPWQRDEISAGLLIGCRMADERNAVLSQRVLRALAQEDARIPSWSVVDRAARKSGQTGGAWLQEARRRHQAAAARRGVRAPYGAEAAMRASA